MSATMIYILACEHVMPGPEGLLMTRCHSCNCQQSIVDVHVYEWHATCLKSSCIFRKYTGLSRVLADYCASAHAHAHPDHKVGVGYGRNPKSVKYREKLVKRGAISGNLF